jgi:hypothetical protein
VITPNLIAWQFDNYPLAHATRRNLAIHIVTGPLFVCSLLAAPGLFVRGQWVGGMVALSLVLVAVAAQGSGHRGEPNPPAPFRSPLDIVARLVVEQFVTLPRFIVSGGWGRAWRTAPPAAPR